MNEKGSGSDDEGIIGRIGRGGIEGSKSREFYDMSAHEVHWRSRLFLTPYFGRRSQEDKADMFAEVKNLANLPDETIIAYLRLGIRQNWPNAPYEYLAYYLELRRRGVPPWR